MDEESRLPKKHVLSVDISNQGTAITPADLEKYFRHLSIFNVHYDANAQIIQLNPGLPRVLAFNETGFNGTGDDLYRIQGWQFLLSGGGLYGHLDFSFTAGHEDGSASPRFLSPTYNGGGGPGIRKQLKILLDFMNSLPLEKMRPDNSIVVGGADRWSVLAWGDHAYAVWLPGEGPVSPLLALPAGDWRVDWVDILSGSVTSHSINASKWVTPLSGNRRGGGVALRVVRPGTAP